MPRKTFVAGEILTAADLNTNVADQVVFVFDDAAARDLAITSPIEGMVAYLKSTDTLFRYTTSWNVVNTAFTASTTITATNASFSVPSLGAPIVRVTVVGSGGGGGSPGGAGNTTTFDAGGAGSLSAAGGAGGRSGAGTVVGPNGTAGIASANGAQGPSAAERNGATGGGGKIETGYFNLSGISTVNITIGAGGAGNNNGGTGGRGEVLIEYVAA